MTASDTSTPSFNLTPSHGDSTKLVEYKIPYFGFQF